VELRDALRTTGAIRRFTSRPVDGRVLYDILDDARFAPSGGNRQAWRVIVVNDEARRRAIAAAYLDAWHDYLGHVLAGVVPFSPLATHEERQRAEAHREAAERLSQPGGFPETLASVPAMLVVVVDLTALAATDRDLGRYQFAGGASIYPFVWSLLLAAHERGLGGVMTTVATRNEARLRPILGLGPSDALASVVVLGYPKARPTRLARRGVETFATIDDLAGEPFTG